MTEAELDVVRARAQKLFRADTDRWLLTENDRLLGYTPADLIRIGDAAVVLRLLKKLEAERRS